ncbi:LPXTG cell wall anchor domain-containing protein [Streptomyces lavendulae]|uniref:LPXTG cell wall anchor domain-containing protein n=1 Tax=Streptomyces lavendulae TaxID=1914 RepID=UPI00380C9118
MRQRISLPVACGLAAAGLATAITPAFAAEPVLTLTAPAALALPLHPASGSPKPVALDVRLDYPGTAEGLGTEVTFTVDLAKLAGVASVRESAAGGAAKCKPVASTLVCTEQGVRPGSRPGVGLEVTAAKDAKNKDSGEIRVTGAVSGATVRSAVTAVTVGGPDLVMGEMALKGDPKPGESQPLPLAFSNRGTQSANGVVLELEASRGMELAERYDNCEYRTTRTSTTAVCTVDGEFEAGASYELAGESPLHLKATGRARAELLGYGIYPAAAPVKAEQAQTGADAKPAPGDQAAKDPAGKTPAGGGGGGTGGHKLAAKKRAAALTPALRGPDLNPADNRREFVFGVVNTADLVAEPLVVKGKAGTTVKTAVAVRNQGPAWVFEPRSTAPAAVVDVVVPPGVKVLTAPAACRSAGTAAAPRYLCTTGSSLLESEKAEFPFELRIDKAVPDARGAITVGRPGPGGEPQRHPFDPVLANNLASFTVNPTGPAPSPSATASPKPTASASASASPSAGPSAGTTPTKSSSGGGPLASTGSTAGVVGLAGAALVAAGGALFLAFRRRAAGRA